MALPAHVAHYLGVTDTTDVTSLSIDPLQPFQISTEVWKYKPWKYQFLRWFMENSRYRPTTTSKFHHSERPAQPNFVVFIGDDETSQGTTDLVFQNAGTRLSKWSRVMNTRTNEIILFQTDFDSDGITSGDVLRSAGTSGTPLLLKGDVCKILSKGKPEGEDMGKGTQGDVNTYSFRTGIMEWPVQMTGTKAAERTLEGDPFAVALQESWEQTNDQLESTFLFSGAVDLNPAYSTYALHIGTGIFPYISTNVFSVDGFLTRFDIWNMIMEWKTFWKGQGGAIVTSQQVITQLNQIAFEKVQYTSEVRSDGIDINKITVPGQGTFELIDCDLLGQDPYLAGLMFFLPGDGIDYRPLIGSENRDISYMPVNRDEKDLKEGKIMGEFGVELFGEENFAVATGIEF